MEATSHTNAKSPTEPPIHPTFELGEVRRILTDVLRQAGSVSARAAPPLTRLIAWTSEIVMRPLISPLVDTDAGARLRDARTDMRIMR